MENIKLFKHIVTLVSLIAKLREWGRGHEPYALSLALFSKKDEQETHQSSPVFKIHYKYA